MFCLLHLHFESVLRAIAATRPDLLRKVYYTFSTRQYRAASPAERLHLLEEQIRLLAQQSGLFTEEVFERVVHVFLKELEWSQVEHADLRIGVSLGKWSWMRTLADGIAVFQRALDRYPQITLSFLAALNFAKSRAEIDEIVDLLLTDHFVQQTFVGIDINVAPADLVKFAQYAPSLLLAQQRGMKINIHLGELFENAFSQEVLSFLVPNRIGHGVRLLEDDGLVDLIQRHHICLDMCPVSNTRLGVWDWRQPNNPAKRAMQFGIPVSINTDDPILFQTTLAQEMALAHLNVEEIKLIQATGRTYGYRER